MSVWNDSYQNYFKGKSICFATCKCRKRVWIYGRDRSICSQCGNYVYKDDKTEFIYKLNETRYKEKRNEYKINIK